MVHNEADEEPTQPNQRWHGSEQRQLYQALFDLQTKCFRLAAALGTGLPPDIEAASTDLAAAWFAATIAIKAAHARSVDTQDAQQTGMLALRATHQVLFELFELSPPVPDTEVPQLRAVLSRLSSRIGHSLASLADTYASEAGSEASCAAPSAAVVPVPNKPVYRARDQRHSAVSVARVRRS